MRAAVLLLALIAVSTAATPNLRKVVHEGVQDDDGPCSTSSSNCAVNCEASLGELAAETYTVSQ